MYDSSQCPRDSGLSKSKYEVLKETKKWIRGGGGEKRETRGRVMGRDGTKRERRMDNEVFERPHREQRVIVASFTGPGRGTMARAVKPNCLIEKRGSFEASTALVHSPSSCAYPRRASGPQDQLLFHRRDWARGPPRPGSWRYQSQSAFPVQNLTHWPWVAQHNWLDVSGLTGRLHTPRSRPRYWASPLRRLSNSRSSPTNRRLTEE
jgi:hypothetical protein